MFSNERQAQTDAVRALVEGGDASLALLRRFLLTRDYAAPAVAGDVLYLATANRLYAITARP